MLVDKEYYEKLKSLPEINPSEIGKDQPQGGKSVSIVGKCKWQVLFHKFRQLFFHNYRHFIFHVFNLPRIAPWEWCLLKW